MIYTLSIGLDEKLVSQFKPALTDVQNTDIPYDLDKIMEPLQNPPSLIFCGLPPSDISTAEIAQILRSQYQGASIFLVGESKDKLDRKTLIKNGFTDVYFLPLDQEMMVQSISEMIVKLKNIGKLYRQVKVIDLKSDSVLDFDTYIYLPVNNKHIKFSKATKKIEGQKIQKLKETSTGSLFVSHDELSKFYQYTAKLLKEMGSSETLSETEKTERLHSAVRDLFSGMFTDTSAGIDSGKKVVEDCQNIIKSYLTAGKSDSWYERILNASSKGSDIYSKATNVSTYAALFGMALGLKTVEDIALAGLLHDIGLARVPYEILRKSPDQWTPEEKAIYQQHPEFSIELIKERKLIVSDLVYKIIQQHHEKFSGTGFPKAYSGGRICIEAQLIALADLFEDMIATAPGKVKMTPAQAIKELHAMSLADPSKAAIDPSILKKIMTLFPADVVHGSDSKVSKAG